MQQQLMTKVLDVLAESPQLGMPSTVADALQYTAYLLACVGDLSFVYVVQQQAEALKFSGQDVLAVISSALEGATMVAGSAEGLAREQIAGLVELCSLVVATAKQNPEVVIDQGLGRSLLSALLATPAVADQLLVVDVPLRVVEVMLESALASGDSKGLKLLLQYCVDSDQLQQLPDELMAAAAGAPGPLLAGAAQLRLQVLEVLLQEGRVPSATAAATLVGYQQNGELQWQQLLDWVATGCMSTPPAAAAGFLWQLLSLRSSEQQQLSPEQSWQLYELLLSCQEGWKGEQQGLPAAAADALIQQQGKAGGKAADRVVVVWEHFAGRGGGRVIQLQPAGQRQVVFALVQVNADDGALALVQHVPQQLGALVAAWTEQKQQEGIVGHLHAELLARALQLTVEAGTSEAAAAAEQLLDLVKQQQQQAGAGLLHAEAAEAVLQLLCKHGRVGAAGWLLQRCESPAAVVTFFSAGAKQPVAEQEKALVEFRMGVGSQLGLLLAALTLLLPSKDAAAVGLLWEALQATKQDGAPLLSALTDTEQQQLIELCCSSSVLIAAAPSFTPQRLAQEAVMCNLPAELAARLVTFMVRDHEELQPCRAAVILGMVDEEKLAEAGGSSGSRQGSQAECGEGAAASVKCAATVQLVAQLCLLQLGDTSSSDDIGEVEAAVDWVARLSPNILSPEAAAATLFAVWCFQQQKRTITSQVAAGVLGLSLYHAARKGDTLSAGSGWTAKPSLDSLVLDLALVAAAGAGKWEEGEAAASIPWALSFQVDSEFMTGASVHVASMPNSAFLLATASCRHCIVIIVTSLRQGKKWPCPLTLAKAPYVTAS